jgi:hypothetical protein
VADCGIPAVTTGGREPNRPASEGCWWELISALQHWRSYGAPLSEIAVMILEDFSISIDETDVRKLITGFDSQR